MKRFTIVGFILALVIVSCTQERVDVNRLVENYAQVTIPAPDLSGITDNGKEVLKMYRMAADEVDKIYWQQYNGNHDFFLASLAKPAEKQYAEINYGPWDRINGKAFLPGYGPKPAGAGFYPADMTSEEYLSWNNPDKSSPYTLIRRAADGSLKTIWYHDAFAQSIKKIEECLNRAADVTIKESVRNYLLHLIEGLKTDDYYESNKAWLEMNDSKMDLVLGPIEAVDDGLYGTKSSYGAYVLLKNLQRTEELNALSARMPEYQKMLPGDPANHSFVASISPMTQRFRRNWAPARLSSTTSSARSSTAPSTPWAAPCLRMFTSLTWTLAHFTG